MDEEEGGQQPKKHFSQVRQFKSGGLPTIPGTFGKCFLVVSFVSVLIFGRINSSFHLFLVLVFLLYVRKGIFPLSKTEIKKDVREMERSMHDDTDSDGSVMSDDVLPSTYPVKPRKTAKIPLVQRPSAMSSADAEAAEYDSKMVEQTLTFLDSVKRNKKDLYHVECERERLESQALVCFHFSSELQLVVFLVL